MHEYNVGGNKTQICETHAHAMRESWQLWVCQSDDDINTLLDCKYVHIEYMWLALRAAMDLKKKCVLFLPTVVVTREAQYFLACLGSTERFAQKAMASANAEFSRKWD